MHLQNILSRSIYGEHVMTKKPEGKERIAKDKRIAELTRQLTTAWEKIKELEKDKIQLEMDLNTQIATLEEDVIQYKKRIVDLTEKVKKLPIKRAKCGTKPFEPFTATRYKYGIYISRNKVLKLLKEAGRNG